MLDVMILNKVVDKEEKIAPCILFDANVLLKLSLKKLKYNI